jgi:hypothetical protein
MRAPRRRTLVSALFEDAAEDEVAKEELMDFMKTPLKSAGENPAEKLSEPAKELVKKATGDDDKKITGSAKGTGKPIPVLELKASQNEVGKKNSLANVCAGVNATWDGIDWGDVDWLIDHMKPGAVITFSNALLGAKTSDGNVVLDGHHRWSQAFMLNPECSVNVVFANANELTADQTLKAVHLAILAKTGQSKTKKASGGNLFDATEADVLQYFDAPKKFIDPATGEEAPTGVAPYVYAVMKMQGITDPDEGKDAAVSRVMDAITKCAGTVVTDAPKRDSMPQADSETNPIDASAVMSALSKGEINYNPPYVKTVDESRRVRASRSDDEVILERWHKLAGLIK